MNYFRTCATQSSVEHPRGRATTVLVLPWREQPVARGIGASKGSFVFPRGRASTEIVLACREQQELARHKFWEYEIIFEL